MTISTQVLPNGDHLLRVASKNQGVSWHCANLRADGELEMLEIPSDLNPLVEIQGTTERNWLGTITLKADTIPQEIKDKMT